MKRCRHYYYETVINDASVSLYGSRTLPKSISDPCNLRFLNFF